MLAEEHLFVVTPWKALSAAPEGVARSVPAPWGVAAVSIRASKGPNALDCADSPELRAGSVVVADGRRCLRIRDDGSPDTCELH